MRAGRIEVAVNRDELSHFGLGSLVHSASQKEISYQPFEISRYGMGILAPQGMSNGSILVLDNPAGRFYMHVVDSEVYGTAPELRRYYLVNVDQEIDLEDMFGKFAQPHMSALRHFEPIRFARFHADPNILVHAKTFGTVGFYSLQSVNVSRSGMLISAARDRSVPFLENTLLEVTLVPGGHWLFQPVHCLAKVVRVGESTDRRGNSHSCFGVKFIEFQDAGQNIWDKTVSNLEHKTSRQIFVENIMP